MANTRLWRRGSPFVGLLTDMFRGGTLSAPPSPSQLSPVTRFRGKGRRSMLTAQRDKNPAVSRFFTWFPCSANKNACPALGERRGRAFATKAGALWDYPALCPHRSQGKVTYPLLYPMGRKCQELRRHLLQKTVPRQQNVKPRSAPGSGPGSRQSPPGWWSLRGPAGQQSGRRSAPRRWPTGEPPEPRR